MLAGTTIRKANLYDQFRLPYAPEAVERLLATTGRPETLVDIGAGTGQLARLFAPHCGQVVAVEPDPAMLSVARSSLADIGNLRIVEGSAESTTLPNAHADLLVIGNAYHRFGPTAVGELRRILRPEAQIALFWYLLPEDLSSMLFGRLAALEGLAARTSAAWQRLPEDALFGDAQLHTITVEQAITENWETFFGSACAGIEAPEPGDREFGAFEQINRDVFDHFAVDGLLNLSYHTQVRHGCPAID